MGFFDDLDKIDKIIESVELTVEALCVVCEILKLDYIKYDLTIDLVAKAEIALCDKHPDGVFWTFVYPVREEGAEPGNYFRSSFTLNSLKLHVEEYNKDELTARVKAIMRATKFLYGDEEDSESDRFFWDNKRAAAGIRK